MNFKIWSNKHKSKNINLCISHLFILIAAIISLVHNNELSAMDPELEEYFKQNPSTVNLIVPKKTSSSSLSLNTKSSSSEDKNPLGLYREKQKAQLRKEKEKLPEVDSYQKIQILSGYIYYFMKDGDCKIIGKHHTYESNALPEIAKLKKIYSFVEHSNSIAASEKFPRIIQYRGILKGNDVPIILLEKAEGEPLIKFFHSVSLVPSIEESLVHAYEIGLQLGKFYAKHADENGVVSHGDLHLENLFYDKSNRRVWLIDTSSISRRKTLEFQYELHSLFKHDESGPHKPTFFYPHRGEEKEIALEEIKRKTALLNKMAEGILEGIKDNKFISMEQTQELLKEDIDITNKWMQSLQNSHLH